MRRIYLLALIMMIKAQAAETTFKQTLLSPVTTDASPYFWTGTALTVGVLLTEDQFSDPASKRINDKKTLGDASKLGDLYGQVVPNALYFIGMGAYAYFADDKTSYSRAKHMMKATLYAGAVATVIKYTAREPRPDNSKEKNSFPSGHSTTAFAFATVVATQHEWYWGTLALGAAALTGVSRMNDGRHFLHDVLAGTTIGVSYGLGTYYTAFEGQGKKYALVPILDEERTGLSVATTF